MSCLQQIFFFPFFFSLSLSHQFHFIDMSKKRVTDFFKPKESVQSVSEEKINEPPKTPNSTLIQQQLAENKVPMLV